jgi:hypothetical protein
VRHTAWALVVVAAVAGRARADDDSDVVPFRRWSVGASFYGHAGHLDGKSASAFGPAIELARGSGRVQYFAEGSAAFASLGGADTIAMNPPHGWVDGYELRGGLGLRWLARQFPLGDRAALEMHLEVVAGVESFRWFATRDVTRPDIGFGWAWNVRLFRRFSFHETARVVFSPSDRVDAIAPVACRGCTPTSSVPSAALMVMLGVAL